MNKKTYMSPVVKIVAYESESMIATSVQKVSGTDDNVGGSGALSNRRGTGSGIWDSLEDQQE